MNLNEERFVAGNMNKDSIPELVKQPDIIDSQNTRVVAQQEGLQNARQPVIGNETPFAIGTIESSQNEIVRFIPSESFLTLGGDLALSFTNLLSTGPANSTQSGTFAIGGLNQFKTFVDGLVTASGFTYSSAVNLTANSVDYTFTSQSVLIAASTSGTGLGSEEVQALMIQEYISADEGGGDLKMIGSENLGDYLYVWSCNKDELPDSGYAVGEVGRATYSDAYNIWNYTRMSRSKQFRFIQSKQIDTPKLEQNDYRVSMYWCGDSNPARAMYSDVIMGLWSLDSLKLTLSVDEPDIVDFEKFVVGSTVTMNGEARVISSVDTTNKTLTVSSAFTIQYLNSYLDVQDICMDFAYDTGEYSFNTIGQEIQQTIVSTIPTVTFSQVVTGGAVTSGNKQYVVRGVTADFTTYDWSRVGGFVNMTSYPNNSLTLGDYGNVNTGKAVELVVSNINSDLFAYVDVAVLDYTAAGVSGTLFKRAAVGGDTIRITHLGVEADATPLDLTELASAGVIIEQAYTNEIVDNRDVLANVELAQPVNLQDWCLTFEHTLFKQPISYTALGQNFGEYMYPANVYNYGGAMYNEVYRIGCRVRFTNGAVATYWVDDIKIDTSATNITAGTTWNGQVLPNRRLGGLANLDLTDSDGFVYSAYIEFTINWEYDIDGTPVKLLVDSIEFVRAKVIREVLTSGMALISTTYYVNAVPLAGLTRRPFFGNHVKVEGELDRKGAFFLSPDVLFGQVDVTDLTGCSLLVYCRPPLYEQTGGADYRFQAYTGDFSTNNVDDIQQTISIPYSSLLLLNRGIVLNGYGFQNLNEDNSFTPTKKWVCEDAVAMQFGTTTLDAHGTGSDDTPIYYCQLYRPVAYTSPDSCKYGNVYSTVYQPCSFVQPSSNGTVTAIMFLNDVFTQQTFLKQSYPMLVTGQTTASVRGYGLSFYSQNLGNYQMRSWTEDNTNLKVFPNAFAGDEDRYKSWLQYKWVNDGAAKRDEFKYDASYNYRGELQNEVADNPDLPVISRSSTAIYYSDVKIQNSFADSYRKISAGNVKYLNNSDGPIRKIIKIGSELFAFQDFNFTRLYFNSRGEMVVSDASTVLIGAGGVMNRDGYSITKYGCKHRESVIRGLSASGDDTVYWYDTFNKKMLRFGANGVTVISETGNIQVWLEENARWASGYFHPAWNYGICGVFDKRYRECIMTFRGQKITADYVTQGYVAGQVVAYTTPYENNLYQLPKTLYRALISGVLPAPTGAASDTNWEFVPLSDTDYYSWTTIAYSEYSGGYGSIYGFVPKIYGRYKDAYVTASPQTDEETNIYLHNIGLYCTWWTNFEYPASVTIPFNRNSTIPQRFISIWIDSSEAPERVDFSFAENSLTSYLEEAEFTVRRDDYVAPIKNTSNVSGSNPSGLNNLATGNMKGKTLIVKHTFVLDENSKNLKRIEVRSRDLYRLPTA